MTEENRQSGAGNESDHSDKGLTYSEVGVDIEASESATEALISKIGEFDSSDYAGMIDIGDRYLALAADGVGTKLLVAEAVGDYSTVGIDCIAMNVNDLVAVGIDPVAFVDYLAVEEPDDATAEEIGHGLASGAEQADIALLGGETAVMPEVIDGLDLAGTCAGLATRDELFTAEIQPGDALVGWPSSGIHSNGLTLARKAVTRDHSYSDPFPKREDRTIGEVLLEPTRIYTDLLEPMRHHGVRSAAHITGGGWTNLKRLGEFNFEISNPFPIQPIFDFIQSKGVITDEEMHRTFNMGTGFVAALPESNAINLAESTDGRLIGRVSDGEGVDIRGLEL